MFFSFFEELLANIGFNKNKHNITAKKLSKYTTTPIELHNTNIVYPDNKLEKEIQCLYAEIRDIQSKSSSKNIKQKLSYYKNR